MWPSVPTAVPKMITYSAHCRQTRAHQRAASVRKQRKRKSDACEETRARAGKRAVEDEHGAHGAARVVEEPLRLRHKVSEGVGRGKRNSKFEGVREATANKRHGTQAGASGACRMPHALRAACAACAALRACACVRACRGVRASTALADRRTKASQPCAALAPRALLSRCASRRQARPSRWHRAAQAASALGVSLAQQAHGGGDGGVGVAAALRHRLARDAVHHRRVEHVLALVAHAEIQRCGGGGAQRRRRERLRGDGRETSAFCGA